MTPDDIIANVAYALVMLVVAMSTALCAVGIWREMRGKR